MAHRGRAFHSRRLGPRRACERMELTVREASRLYHPLVRVALGAFGAQAVLAGLFAALSRFAFDLAEAAVP